MTLISFARIGPAASVAGLVVFSAAAVSAVTPTSACPGNASIGPTANLIPAPAGMPLNCTVAFSDGTVNFAGQVTGQATDGFTTTTTMYDQSGQVVGATNSLGETIVPGPGGGAVDHHRSGRPHDDIQLRRCGIGGPGQRPDGEHHALRLRRLGTRQDGDESARPHNNLRSDLEGRMTTLIDTAGKTTDKHL